MLGFSACDLQPKITSIPDNVGEFISTKYPTLLADPVKEPEIYNSAVTDYGVYENPELYGTNNINDYVQYESVDDYKLKIEKQSPKSEQQPEKIIEEKSEKIEEPEQTFLSSPDDYLTVPTYVAPEKRETMEIIVGKGDTLYSLSRKYELPVNDLAIMNNLSAPFVLSVGQKIKVPKTEIIVPQVIPEKTESVLQQPQIITIPNEIIVGKSDTLYSISRKYSLPVKDLIELNKLSKPYNLKAGQKLKLSKPVIAVVKTVPEKPVKKIEKNNEIINETPLFIIVGKYDTLYSISRKYSVPVNDLIKINKLSKPYRLKNGQKLRLKSLDEKPFITQSVKSEKITQKPIKEIKEEKVSNNSTSKQKEKVSSSPTRPLPTISARASTKFSWPVRGKILSDFGAKSNGLFNDGINIGTQFGTMVFASENGVVAYSGNELKGMGNLIIIQHAGGWMTVYAHLDTMTVKRGTRVAVGQKIGTVGQTGKVDRPQLHFEIRKGTKAYDPQSNLNK